MNIGMIVISINRIQQRFYDDRDLKPEESIYFKLRIIPFGETSSPNLKN